MKSKIFLAALLAASLSSCASYAPVISQTELNRVQPGVTTEAELVHWFGQPDTKIVSFNSDASLQWFRTQPAPIQGYVPLVGSFIGGLDVDVQQLTVAVDHGGRVTGFSIYDSNGRVKSEHVYTHTTTRYGK